MMFSLAIPSDSMTTTTMSILGPMSRESTSGMKNKFEVLTT